jgi:hypothetical protein
MMDIGKALNGCDKLGGKGVNEPKEDERIGHGKLGRMGMMGGWMEARAQLGIRVKLTTSSPSSAY